MFLQKVKPQYYFLVGEGYCLYYKFCMRTIETLSSLLYPRALLIIDKLLTLGGCNPFYIYALNQAVVALLSSNYRSRYYVLSIRLDTPLVLSYYVLQFQFYTIVACQPPPPKVDAQSRFVASRIGLTIEVLVLTRLRI